MTRLILLALLLIGSAHAADRCEPPPRYSEFSGTVTAVIDGDTLQAGCWRVRLGDFDAPERGEPGGAEATTALREIALGKEAWCLACAGARNPKACRSYGRVIAICKVDGVALGDALRARGVREGGR